MTGRSAEFTVRPITDHDFSRFQKLICGSAGIYLCPAKKGLLEARLTRRLRELGLNSFAAYYQYVVEDTDGEELITLLDRVSTNETHFFREPRQFEFLERQVFPDWAAKDTARLKSRRIRVWSAGCSTGEEPYSLAMILVEQFPASAGWAIEILATDLSTRALDFARRAIWPIARAEEIPSKYLTRFMLKGIGAQEGKMKAGSEIRSIVRFERLNLNDEVYSVSGLFDLIFCRNVLIYFDAQPRDRVIHRLLNHLATSGYLIVGHAESLIGITDRVRHVMPTVYAHAGKRPLGLKPHSGGLGAHL
jgi:chemotaxis protein methyltransferase CheR